ncbi:hypothetical protein FRC0326_02246 [Corynebacterium diphtheriae]|nr:hypothetical protein FRC0326_02246 [Corynebacterium diphtheriae]
MLRVLRQPIESTHTAMIRMDNCPFKASLGLSGMRQSLDNQRYPHVIRECMTDKFARVDVDDRGKVHVLATLTRQVGDVAYIDVVWPVSGESAVY